jgi:putative chitinase
MSRVSATRALVLSLQHELFVRGHRIVIDGVPGPATFGAALEQVKLTPAPAPIGHNGGPPLTLDPEIAMIDAALLKIACPENKLEELALWVEPIRAACVRWGIDEIREIAAFLAQAGHESLGFTHLEENLNYSAKRMAEVWPKRFAVNPGAAQKDRQPNALALQLHRNPELIANHTYANRMGNGPPESGDGWRHRGFGLFQNTGKRNQLALGTALGIALADVPAYLRKKEGAAMGAGFYWKENDLDRLAATPGVEDETQAINGGQHGLDDRRDRFNRIVAELLRREQLGCGRLAA